MKQSVSNLNTLPVYLGISRTYVARTLAEHHQQYMCYQMPEPANY